MTQTRKLRAVAYLRRSTTDQDTSLDMQFSWALRRSAQVDCPLEATAADFTKMQAQFAHEFGPIYLDDGISGSDESRPGLAALKERLERDRSITHILIHKRDRLARPDEPTEYVLLEKHWRRRGLTVVFDTTSVGPLGDDGDGELATDVTALVEYHSGRKMLVDLSERVLLSKRELANGGFRVGGNAPYGFVRVLVSVDGTVRQELDPGMRVRQAGCHVTIRPKDPEKLAIWNECLDRVLNGWSAGRIAKDLNARGIASPDKGRSRKDQGIAHKNSGKWCTRSVLEILRNPAIIGQQRIGQRSEGKHRRLGSTDSRGYRTLTDEDKNEHGKPRIVRNSHELQIAHQLDFEPEYPPDRWQLVQEELDRRGQSQRGIPRVKDIEKYPLSCRIVDLSCGCHFFMYGRTSGKRALYTCGLYMKWKSCACNQVDADAILQVALLAISQNLSGSENDEKLMSELRKLALEEQQRQETVTPRDPTIEVRRQQESLETRISLIRDRMTDETDHDVYAELRSALQALLAERAKLAKQLETLTAVTSVQKKFCAEAEINAALRILERIETITADSNARQEMATLFCQLGLWIGLRFKPGIRGKKQKVQKLAGGVIVFGSTRPPFLMHGEVESAAADAPEQGRSFQPRVAMPPVPTAAELDDHYRQAMASTTKTAPHSPVAPRDLAASSLGPTDGHADQRSHPIRSKSSVSVLQPDGVSFTNVSRGDRI